MYSGLFGSPTNKDLTSSLTKRRESQESETKPILKTGGGGGGGRLFDGDDEDDLFSGTTSKPSSAPVAQETTKAKPSANKVDLFGGDDADDEDEGDLFSGKPAAKEPVQAPPKKKLPAGAVSMFGSSPPPLLIRKKTEDEEQDDTGLFKESKAAPPLKKTPAEVKPPPVSQPSNPKSGGGLFSDEDEEEGGGLFGAPAAKPQPKAEVKSRPKSKTTISLFDDDEQEEEEDFFAAPAPSKPNSAPAKKEPSKEKPKEEVKETKAASERSSGLFDDDDGLFNSPSSKPTPSPNATPKEERKEKTKARSSSKIQTLFDADDDDDDEGMFGGAAEDIFTASPPQSPPQSPQKSFGSVSPLSAVISQAAPSRDSKDGSQASKPKPKPTAAPQKPSLFSDEEEDLFGGKSCGGAEGRGKEGSDSRESQAEETRKRPSFIEDKNDVEKTEPAQKEKEEDDLFSAPSKPVVVKPKKPAGAVSMFGGVDLFGARSKSPPSSAAAAKPRVDPLGGDDEGEDLFASKPKVKAVQQSKPEVKLTLNLPNSVSPTSGTKAKLFPVPPSVSPRTSPLKPASGIEKLQKSLAFNPAMLRPGAAPPRREAAPIVASFDEPAKVTTLESANKDRAKIQVKRRPPTRQARRAAATTSSASEATLFGSTPNDDVAGASARVSWGGFPSPEGLEKSEVDSGQRPQRTDTRDSDMSDEFFRVLEFWIFQGH
ncbi:retrograde transport, endosome to Golgi [Desmophyllum pertusum]|uniref:Retrograde transport, endosome to Golgi n=1 Tax=Desmophyllum pertusum TaxID=174260 RepID=A0A9X0A3I0_9CNID|nr:retrograde transport, endosome to Golgi [Desmophyllum pertusum]